MEITCKSIKPNIKLIMNNQKHVWEYFEQFGDYWEYTHTYLEMH